MFIGFRTKIIYLFSLCKKTHNSLKYLLLLRDFDLSVLINSIEIRLKHKKTMNDYFLTTK